MNSQQSLMFFFIAMILVFSAWNAVKDTEEMHDHHEFFNDVREFMKPGDRNTARMGYESCLYANALAAKIGDVPMRRCKEIYLKKDVKK